MTAIPCGHTIYAIYKSKKHPEDFVHDFLKKPMYLEAYNPVVYPMSGEDLWSNTATPYIETPLFRIYIRIYKGQKTMENDKKGNLKHHNHRFFF